MSNNSRVQNVKSNVIWGIANKVLTIVLMFVVRTVIIYVLGIEYAGLSSLFTSVLNVLNLAELGIGNAIVFSMYKPIAENNSEKTGALLYYYKKCYNIISGIVLVIGLALMPAIPWLIRDKECVADVNIYILYAIYLANTIASYQFMAYKRSLLLASQKNRIESNVLSVVTILQNIAQIIGLLLFKNYYVYILFLPIGTIAFNLFCAKRCNNLFPEIECKGELKKEDKHAIGKLIKGLITQKIGGVVLSSVDGIVISAFLGLAVLGIFNNYYYIVYALFQVLAVIMNALKSSVGNSIAVESVEQNYSTFKLLNFIYTWVVVWITTCLLCVMQDVIELWVGKELMLSTTLMFLWCAYFFFHKWFDILYVFQESAGLWWENRFVPGVAAIVNLTLNIVLIQVIGLAGVILSTIISVVFVYDIGYAYVLFKYYFRDMKKMKEFLCAQVKFLVIFLLAGSVTFYCSTFIYQTGILGLMLKMVVCIIVPNVIMLIFYCRNQELNQCFNIIKRKKG